MIYIIVVGFLSPVFANQETFFTIVNPIRGLDFWGLKNQEPLTAVKEQVKIIEKNNLSATWLLRPDAIFNPEISNYFKNFPQKQELGIFLEVTPIWANEASVDYHFAPLWHYANSAFLSGYNVEERGKLIDRAFEKFKELFGYYPKSVGAWHIDARSLEYMNIKYGLEAALICSDQFSTDDYQIWGGWWGIPYYPSRYNVLIPAQTRKNKLDVVIFQWAARDPLNGYGIGVVVSTYSVQVNDYLKHELNTDYFSNLADIYLVPLEGKFGQLTVGLENDNPWLEVGEEYEREILALVGKNASSLNMTEFSKWYKREFPNLSPIHTIKSRDLLGLQKTAIWIMSPDGRLGLVEEDKKITIRDWRIYNEKWAEPYLEVANRDRQLRLSLPAKIDSVRFPAEAKELTQNPSELFKGKLKLPFETAPYIFVLAIIIFFVFLITGFYLDKWLLPIIAVGIASQVITMVKSGLLYPFGMGFWGPNGHDGIWHIALINELTRHFPPSNPVFSQFNLLNYHYLYDLSVALIYKVTRIPVLNLYFQIFPIITSGLLGILVYLFVKKWSKNEISSLLAAFFAYFGGSLGWVITLIRNQELGGESMFWSSQSASLLINPPLAFSILLLLGGFLLFIIYEEKQVFGLLLALGLIFGLIIGVKAYGGVIIIFGLAMASVWEWVRYRRFLATKIFFISGIVSLLVFLPINRASSSLFVLSPLWFPHTMLAFQDRFWWSRLEEARQAYLATGNWIKLILAETLALFIFLAGNLGTRALGIGKIFNLIRYPKTLSVVQVLFLSCLGISLILPLLFIQKGNPWNSIQFFYYFLFFSGILAAWWIGEFLDKKKEWIKLLFILLIFLFTIPTTLGTLKHYLPSRAPAAISYDELEALQFLNDRPEGVVLTYPFDYSLREKIEAPKPLYAYETTAYVSAFSNKNTFLEDEMNLEIMQVNWKPRRAEVERFFKTDDILRAKNFLQGNKIRYIYLVDDQYLSLDPTLLRLEKIFENGSVKIYEFHDKI